MGSYKGEGYSLFCRKLREGIKKNFTWDKKHCTSPCDGSRP